MLAGSSPWLVTGRIARPVRSRRSSNFNSYWDIPAVRIETVSEFQMRAKPRFDLVLCANVLSAIPTRNARTRALQAIKRRLKLHGVALVVNQHTNSYFSKVARRDDVVRHLDGYLLPRNGWAFYYGILDKETTADILTREGYEIIEHWIEGQSNYALARIR